MSATPESNEPQKQPKGIVKIVSEHPVFTLVCGIATLLGTVFGIWGYFASITKPDLTYYISPTRTPILQSGKLDNFTLTYLGNQITNDLSSAEIQIWNAGKAPIQREDILKTISLNTPHGEPIYQTTVKTSRDVIGLNLISNTNQKSGVFTLDFRILEHNDGIRLQIIYGGSVDLPLTLDGVIKGQPQGFSHYQINNKPSKIQIFLSFLVTFTGAILGLLFGKKGTDYLSTKDISSKSAIVAVISILFSTFLVFAVVILLSVAIIDGILPLTTSKPPFGL